MQPTARIVSLATVAALSTVQVRDGAGNTAPVRVNVVPAEPTLPHGVAAVVDPVVVLETD